MPFDLECYLSAIREFGDLVRSSSACWNNAGGDSRLPKIVFTGFGGFNFFGDTHDGRRRHCARFEQFQLRTSFMRRAR